MAQVIENVEASLLNFCKRFAEAVNIQHPDWNFKQVSFDSYATEGELPLQDLVGLNHVMVELDEHQLIVECLFGVSTYEDENGFRMKAAASHLFEELKPTRTLPYLDATTGGILGFFSIKNGTRMMPVGGDQRFVRFFIVQLGLQGVVDLRQRGLL